ncbi:PglZ domain-containing protein [uncultured Treponema sp.]|uniref:PglZ domain-containing protein n=1 Tax=uncultured Treponema sp. TaxID=162155 RepID=UPI002587695C|nr:PglZ domain-containing protein [uncultured Treponema sp.]
MSYDVEGDCMSRWFETIIQKVTPSTNKPIIVIDSQKYLEITEVQDRLIQEDYKVNFVEPGIQVRMKYELEVKGRKKTILVITGKYPLVDDMKESAFVVDLKPKDIFRNFDENAISGLSFNALSTIDSLSIFNELSYEETIQFMLENLYGIDFQAWKLNKSKERCLAILISVYTNNEKPNKAINDFLENIGKPYFGTKVKDFSDKQKLLEFINALKSEEINFENPMLAKEIANLKITGSIENNIESKQEKDLQKLINELFEFLTERIKTIGDQYKDWFEIAPKLGELGYAIFELNNKEYFDKYNEILNTINNRFQLFVNNHYDSLFSMSGLRYPITIDKVQDYIAASTKNNKIAFIVIDGMNYWQWTLLKHYLENEKLNVEEKTTLSWLPSITAWARQSIFAGKKPNLLIDNATEGDLFKKYWMEKHQKMYYQVSYEKIKTEQKLSVPSPDVLVAGFVVNALDEMMHENILGYEQLYSNTKLWIEKSGFCKSIKELKNAGFEIYISTDHGNVESELNLKLSAGQKSLVHSRSKRFIQFDTEEQAASYIENHLEYQLGKKDKSVYFKDTNGFGNPGEKVITHGGSHILELIIPVGVVK